MSFEDLDLNNVMDDDELPPEGSGNRTFAIIAGILGVLALLAMVCIAVYALVLVPKNKLAQTNQRATLDAQNTSVAGMVESTSTADALAAIIAAYTKTSTSTPEFTATFTPSPEAPVATTAVVALTDTPNAQTATAAALFATLDANATRLAGTITSRPPATSIPNTGFADDIGLPMMLGLAVVLIAVIFLARRLRTA